MQVADLIFRDLTSVSEHAAIKTVVRIMTLNRFYSVPVVSDLNEYVGCISESDIIEACIPAYMKTMQNTAFLPDINKMADNLKMILDKKVIEFMPDNYPVVKPTDSISYAADLMNKTNRRVIPVIDNKQLMGTINRIDLLSIALKKDKTQG